VKPIERGADVAMGLYRPLTTSFFEQCAAAVSIKDREEIRPESYLPSARSVAFLRDAFDDAGGYPEWLEIGEDMYLNQRWRTRGARMRLAEGAVVLRRPRPDPASYWRQFTAYAEGDALAGMLPQRHAARFAAYGSLALALGSRSRTLKALVLVAGGAYASRPVRRAFRRVPEPSGRLASIVAVPAMMAFTDIAKMAGYLRGLVRAGRRG